MFKAFTITSAALAAGLLAVYFTNTTRHFEPEVDPPATRPQPPAKDFSKSPIVVKLMSYCKKDDKVVRADVTDERLLRFFDQADAKKEGVVTQAQLIALAAKLDAEESVARRTADGDGPADGRGRGPGGPGRGGLGGPGGRGPGGPPRLGVLLPEFIQEMLNLTDDQKKQLAALQKDTDAKIDEMLTDAQKKQYKEIKEKVGRGGPGGGRGPGGPGGPPPDGPPPGDGNGPPSPDDPDSP
jgi:hypothetical protein